MLLGDMGAEVIKIETPGEGDPVRRQGVIRDGLSWYFAGFNRNKRSLTLNLRHEEGREVLAKLIAARCAGREFPSRGSRPHRVRRSAAQGAQPRPHLLPHHRLRRQRALSRPSLVRFHRPGDERLHERDRRARRPASARRSADRRFGRRALCRARGLCRAGAPRPHRPRRHGRSQPQQHDDQHAGFSCRELSRDRPSSRRAPATTMRSSHPMGCSAPPTARWRSRHRARRSTIGCSTRLARPSCGTTRISAATTTAFETAGR